MKATKFYSFLVPATLALGFLIMSSSTAQAQSSTETGDIAQGNVTISGANGFSENNYGGNNGFTQGGTFNSLNPLPFTFDVRGISGGMYAYASCTVTNYYTGVNYDAYDTKTGTNINELYVTFNWTPPSSGTYYIQCRAQYVPSNNPGVTGGPQGGIGTTGEILFTIN